MKKEAKVVLSIDYGTKNIGICVGETYTGQTRPLQRIQNGSSLENSFDDLLDEWRPNLFLLGIPSKMTSDFANGVDKLKDLIKNKYKIDLIEINEDFTSQGLAKNKKDKLKDSYSAELIFEDWFNQNYG